MSSLTRSARWWCKLRRRRICSRRDPDRAHRALAAVTETGRAALADTSRLLRFIRDLADDDPAPAPSLAELDALIAGFAKSGLDVQLDVRATSQRCRPGYNCRPTGSSRSP